MRFEHKDIVLLFEISIMSLALFSILFMLLRDRRQFFWAIVCMLSIVLFSVGKITSHPNFHTFRTPFIAIPAWKLLLPPTLYLFIRGLLGRPKISIAKMTLHFLPFMFFYVYFLLPILLKPQLSGSPIPINRPPTFGLFFLGSLIIVYTIYFLTILRMITRHKKEYVHFFSSSDNYNTLLWIKRLTIVLFICFLGNTFLLLIYPPQHPNPGNPPPLWIFGIVLNHFFLLGIVSFFGLFIMNQPMLFPQNWKKMLEKKNDIDPIIIQKKKKQLVGIIAEGKEASIPVFSMDDRTMIEQLEEFMKTNQPYLAPKLKIADLALDIGTTPHYLSKLINDYYGYNFFYFVNHYRINYACELLEKREAELFTIEGIGKQSGFNSRGRFSDWFKKVKGLSPGAYRKLNYSVEN